MSEFWVSKKKYWCTYCETFITDDKPSRTQHEGGLRHQGNKERYVRQIYKTGEKRKRDAQEEQREMAGINQAAQAAYAQDIANGRAKSTPSSSSSSSTTPARTAPKPAPKPTNPFANYSTADQLGFKDEEAELQAELAAQRSKEGTVGAWQVVVPPPPPLPEEAQPREREEGQVDVKPPVHEQALPPDEDDLRAFKVRKKTASFGLGEIYDPGIIKVKKRETAVTKEEPIASEKDDNKPKWQVEGWEQVDEANPSVVPPGGVVTAEEVEDSKERVKDEAAPPAPVFKKRKGPAQSVVNRGGRRF